MSLKFSVLTCDFLLLFSVIARSLSGNSCRWTFFWSTSVCCALNFQFYSLQLTFIMAFSWKVFQDIGVYLVFCTKVLLYPLFQLPKFYISVFLWLNCSVTASWGLLLFKIRFWFIGPGLSLMHFSLFHSNHGSVQVHYSSHLRFAEAWYCFPPASGCWTLSWYATLLV